MYQFRLLSELAHSPIHCLLEWDTQWLRENIGLVLQKNHIFDGSIEEIIIISHNIGQIIDADYIYVLQQGRVVQQGSPADVYRQGGLYKEIFDASARSMNADKIAATTDF